MKNNKDPAADERQLAQRLLDIVNSSWMSQATYVAAKFGLADLLEHAPRSSSDLATALDCDPDALYQLLRALCSLDICRERDDGTFEISAMGRLLGSHSPYSVRSWTTHWGSNAWLVWGHLYDSVKTGAGMRERVTGMAGFEQLKKDARAAENFNAAMHDLTRLMMTGAAGAYDFSGKRVADIGGGYGQLLAAVLEEYPSATGILFDMEHPIEDARRHFTERGVADRCEFLSGDFFESVPAGADVYLLKSVIHDWNDERAREILRTCRRAMSPDARLLLLERIVPARMQPTPEHRALARSDLNMRVMLGAQERTEVQLAALLHAAGFGSIRSWPADSEYTYFEAAPQSE
jgi:ubiquinone/menaquinone biosynthesis C-methylase UbiE